MFRDGPLEELFRSPRAEEDPISTKEFFVDFQSYLTEVIDSTNPISMSERFQKAKEQEVEVLNSRGTWEIVKKSDVPTGANVLGGRFVLALKNVGTENEQDKARFVAQGFADKEKDFLIHNVTSVRQSSVRVLLSFAANKGYRMYSHDVRQAYSQSAEPLTREIYLQPKRNDVQFFGIQEDEVLKLKNPIYGTSDAGDYWDVTIVGHIKVDLEMEPMTGDGSLYAKFEDPDKAAEGLLGMLVDDGLLTGSENFQRLTEKTLERFE